MKINRLIIGLLSICLLSSCTLFNRSDSYEKIGHLTKNKRHHTNMWAENPNTLWQSVQVASSKELMTLRNEITDPTKIAWIELALINKQFSNNTKRLSQKLLAWRQAYPNHPGNRLMPNNEVLYRLSEPSAPKHIALLLPQTGKQGLLAKRIKTGFLKAFYRGQVLNQNQRISFYNTTSSDQIKNLYQKVIDDGADFIVGPLSKEKVETLAITKGKAIPILALNYTPNRFQPYTSKNLFEFGLLPEDEIEQIASRAQMAGKNQAFIIAPRNQFGRRIAKAFESAWEEKGGTIIKTWYFAQDINFNQVIPRLFDNQNNNQKEVDFDVIFLFAEPKEARLIVPLLRYYYTNDISIYAASSIYSGKPDPSKDLDLNGITICDIPAHIRTNLSKKKNLSSRLYAVGQDAYLLSQNLKRLVLLPHFPIYGRTGALMIAPSQKIHRRLPCATIQNGLV